MSEDLSDIVNNVKNMMDSGNIPENVNELLNNLNSNSKKTSNNMLSKKSSDNTSSNKGNELNIDIGTVMKMKSIIDNINQKDDPRTNLLYSLKPYLRESRKNKVDQYVNLLNMTKIADIIKNENKENTNDSK